MRRFFLAAWSLALAKSTLAAIEEMEDRALCAADVAVEMNDLVVRLLCNISETVDTCIVFLGENQGALWDQGARVAFDIAL